MPTRPLLGQQCKPKKRGRTPSATAVAKSTFVMSVRKSVARARARVLADVFRGDVNSKRRFSQSVSGVATGRGKRRRADGDVGQDGMEALKKFKATSATRRKRRAYDLFYNTAWPSLLPGLSFVEKMKEATRKWRSISAAEKAQLEARAKADDDEQGERADTDFLTSSEAGLRLLSPDVRDARVFRRSVARLATPCADC